MLLEPLNLLWIVRATGGDVLANLLTSYRATRSLIEALAESLPQTIASANFVGRHGHASAVFPYVRRSL